MTVVRIEGVEAGAYTIPTDQPEADGTMEWDSITIVVVEVTGGGLTGIGYTYSHCSVVSLIHDKLAETAKEHDAMDPPSCWRAMQRDVRNIGREGLAATAIAAVDTALWDLKARLLNVPLASLFGRVRDAVPIYGSGGFTTYSDDRLAKRLSDWAERDGCQWVKMKVGTNPDQDPRRVRLAKQAIGAAQLMVDGNGAFSAKQALRLAETFAEQAVTWFEEPVSSDDLAVSVCYAAARPPEWK